MRNFLYRDNGEGVNMKKIIFVLLAFLVVAIIAYSAFPEKVAGLMVDLAACNSGSQKNKFKLKLRLPIRRLSRI